MARGRWDTGGPDAGEALPSEVISADGEADHDVFVHEIDGSSVQVDVTFNELASDHGTIHRFYTSDVTAGQCTLSFPTLTFEGVQNAVIFDAVGDSVTIYIDVNNSLAIILGERTVTYS